MQKIDDQARFAVRVRFEFSGRRSRGLACKRERSYLEAASLLKRNLIFPRLSKPEPAAVMHQIRERESAPYSSALSVYLNIDRCFSPPVCIDSRQAVL